MYTYIIYYTQDSGNILYAIVRNVETSKQAIDSLMQAIPSATIVNVTQR